PRRPYEQDWRATMNDNPMRESLLRQNPTASVAFQMLYDLMEAENRRVRRLTTWTWVVWLLSLALLGMYAALVVYVNSSYVNSRLPIWPWTVPVSLAAVGTVLLILQLLARRSATVSQLRVSVAAIEAQLKELAAARTSQPADRKD